MLQDISNAIEATVLLVIAGLVLALLARRFGWRRMGRGLALVTLLAAVPSCLLILNYTEATRYGTFHSEQHKQLTDNRVRSWIPAKASDIHLHSQLGGLEASYTIALSDLLDHVEALYERFAAIRHYADDRDFVRDYHAFHAVKASVEAPELSGTITIHGPRARNGGGSTFTIDTNNSQVRQHSNYW